MKATATDKPPEAGATKKTTIEKAQSWLTVASTAAGVLGAVGTGAVWLIANFYTGTVELNPEAPTESFIVKVYDARGKDSTFHSKVVQLMPGSYHLEVMLPDGRLRHFDTTVKFAETTRLNLSVSDSPLSPPDAHTQGTSVKKKRWYQFWRKPVTKNEIDKNRVP